MYLSNIPLSSMIATVISSKNSFRNSTTFSGCIFSLNFVKPQWWIGGDDESEPTGVMDVDVNGLKGKEYIYAKAISLDRYTRGRIFDGGDRVYLLTFKSSIAEDLSSDAATRFLNSFRLRKKTSNVK